VDAGAGSDPDAPAAGGHRRRRAARRVALDILFQADVTGAAPADVVAAWRDAGRAVPSYAEGLVAEVARRMAEIDAVLGAHLEEWTVPRLAAVDRAILRVAVAEMQTGIPPAVAINEAVEAARELSTEASGRFVNGVLGKIARVSDGDGS
jgi:transcription antitermination protein NusB